jgi:hypothetical protein
MLDQKTEEITHPSFRCKLFVTRYGDMHGRNVCVTYATDDGVNHGIVLTIGTKNADGVPRTDAMCVEEAIQLLLNNAT